MLRVCTARIRAKLLTAIDAGLRVGECNAVRVNHLNLEAGTLLVWSTKTRTDRIIPLTPRLQMALATLAELRAPDALLFAYGGSQVKKGSDVLKKLRPKAGVQFRFHDLRHTFASRLSEVAQPPSIVRVLLGFTP